MLLTSTGRPACDGVTAGPARRRPGPPRSGPCILRSTRCHVEHRAPPSPERAGRVAGLAATVRRYCRSGDVAQAGGLAQAMRCDVIRLVELRRGSTCGRRRARPISPIPRSCALALRAPEGSMPTLIAAGSTRLHTFSSAPGFLRPLLPATAIGVVPGRMIARPAPRPCRPARRGASAAASMVKRLMRGGGYGSSRRLRRFCMSPAAASFVPGSRHPRGASAATHVRYLACSRSSTRISAFADRELLGLE